MTKKKDVFNKSLLEQLQTLEMSYQEALHKFLDCSHHFEDIFKQFHTPNLPFHQESTLSYSTRLTQKLLFNSAGLTKRISRSIRKSRRKKSGFLAIEHIIHFIGNEVLPIYDEFVPFWVWKLQALEFWHFNNPLFHAATAEFQNSLNESNLTSDTIVELSKSIVSFPVPAETNSENYIRTSCLIDETKSQSFLYQFYTMSILRASALDRLLYRLSKEIAENDLKAAILATRKKYSKTVKLVDTFESRVEIMDQVTTTFPPHVAARLKQPYREILREDSAITLQGQQKVILCSDILITHSNKNVRDGSVGVTIFPLDVGMRSTTDAKDPMFVTILSEYGWMLHEFQFVKENSGTLWLTAFAKAQNFLQLRRESTAHVNSCPIALLRNTLQQEKLNQNLDYLQLETDRRASSGMHSLLSHVVIHRSDEIIEKPKQLSISLPNKPEYSKEKSPKPTRGRTKKMKSPVEKQEIPGLWVFGDAESLFTRANMEKLINHPPGNQLYHTFLKRIYCEENLRFVETVVKFKLMPGNNAEIKKEAQRIYDQFISPEADEQVNLDKKQVVQVQEALSKSVVRSNIYEDCYEKIMVLMSSDSFPRFLRSNEFEEYKEIVEELGKKDKRRGLLKLASGVIQRKRGVFKASESSPEVVSENTFSVEAKQKSKSANTLSKSAHLPMTKRNGIQPSTHKKKTSQPQKKSPRKNSPPQQSQKRENFLAKQGTKLKSESSALMLPSFEITRARRSSSLSGDVDFPISTDDKKKE